MTNENARNMNEILAALAEASGVDAHALVPEANGRVNFALDDMGVAIGTSDADGAKSDRAWVAIFVGEVPSDAETLTYLLGQNYLGVSSGDGAFSIEPEMGAVVLHRGFPLPMAAPAFVEAFQQLAGAARAARQRLSAIQIENPLSLSLNFIAV